MLKLGTLNAVHRYTVPSTVVRTGSVADHFFLIGRGRPDSFKVEGGVPWQIGKGAGTVASI